MSVRLMYMVQVHYQWWLISVVNAMSTTVLWETGLWVCWLGIIYPTVGGTFPWLGPWTAHCRTRAGQEYASILLCFLTVDVTLPAASSSFLPTGFHCHDRLDPWTAGQNKLSYFITLSRIGTKTLKATGSDLRGTVWALWWWLRGHPCFIFSLKRLL